MKRTRGRGCPTTPWMETLSCSTWISVLSGPYVPGATITSSFVLAPPIAVAMSHGFVGELQLPLPAGEGAA